MILPATVAGFFPPDSPAAGPAAVLQPDGLALQHRCTALIIVFFTYFYTAVVLNPNDLAENMRKYGGFIPGIRPGTQDGRVHRPGPVAHHAAGRHLPGADRRAAGRRHRRDFNVPFLTFGGTSVLIVVGVALDTLQQIESHLLMRHYEGFVKGGRIRGRQRM